MQPEDLHVVADVADDGELAGREHVVEPSREASAAAPAREQDDLHAGTARSARVRGPTARASAFEIGVASRRRARARGCATVAKRRVSTEAARASGPVQRRRRRSGPEARAHSSCRRGLDEREPGSREPREAPPASRREVGVDDERVSLDARQPCRDGCAEPVARIVDDLDARGHDERDRPSRRERDRPRAAASTTSPSIATAAAARIDDGSRRFASPRYGITIAGTRRSVLRRRSTRLFGAGA